MDQPVDGAAPEAFQALGDEVRLSVLVTLYERDPPVSFSTLHEAAPVEESAGFAYHLRQLTGRYVRKVDEDGNRVAEDDGESDDDPAGYALTYAGRQVARAVTAGTYTESVSFGPHPLDDPCPFCGESGLRARSADNVFEVDCESCGRPVLSLPFPPSGYRDRDPASVVEAFDAHHRHRLSMLREGVCPECAGVVDGRVQVLGEGSSRGPDDDPGSGRESTTDDSPDPGDGESGVVQALFRCDACGYEARSPVALTLLTHPAVVDLFEEHGLDTRDRPLWNVGDEFREGVLSTDPLAVVVSIRIEETLLELFVDGRGEVVGVRRTDDGSDADDPEAGESDSTGGGAPGPVPDPTGPRSGRDEVAGNPSEEEVAGGSDPGTDDSQGEPA